jgi:hypothetical protein
MKRNSAPHVSQDEDIPVERSGWRVIGLFTLYALLSALAAVLSAAIGMLPYWIWPAR